MINIALHVQYRHAAGFGDCVQVTVADAPVHVADGDAIVIPAEDFADFLGCVAMADLG